jgi:hypothetical protein
MVSEAFLPGEATARRSDDARSASRSRSSR